MKYLRRHNGRFDSLEARIRAVLALVAFTVCMVGLMTAWIINAI